MNTLAARDSLFSQLHSDVLKGVGFRKRGHWSMREQGPFIQSVYLRASRFGSSDQAVFWIDVQVFSPEWYELAFSPKAFPGVKEGTPSLISEELGKMCEPSLHSFVITASTSLEDMSNMLEDAIKSKVLPLFAKCGTHEGVLEFMTAKRDSESHGIGPAGICLLLGRESEARRHMEEAKRLAPHENYRRWLELREQGMWARLGKDGVRSAS